jgi:RNA polymerase sigma-70 factor (ECF subfamily)
MEERTAIERLQRGDVGGLEFLVQRYQVRATRAAYLITHDAATAQDVVQTAFVKAYERIEQFDPSRSFGPWFLTSVVRDAIKTASARERHVPFGSDEDESSDATLKLVDAAPGPDVHWEQAETAAEVWAALQRLTPEQRAAVVARYFLGLSEAKMTTALACPPSTVKWRLHAARARLRVLLRPLALL